MLRRLFGAVTGSAIAGLAYLSSFTTPAMAGLGQPTDGELGLQQPATSIMTELSGLYNNINMIIIAIAVFVLLLMLYVMFRFNEKSNPTPSRTSHNTALEVAWTIVPILILVGIAIPSFKLLFEQYRFPKPDLTIKATGNAWFWDHEYLDQGITLSSNMLHDEDVLKAKIGEKEFNDKFGSLEGIARREAVYAAARDVWKERNEPRQLTVDQEIAVPLGKVVHLLVTSNDVIHSWTIPSFGVKQQAVPGRTAAVWFQPDKEGIFYGQCSVLCGKNHSGMPIAVRVVKPEVYDAWMAALKAKDKKKAAEILKAAADTQRANQALAQVQ
ncbi:MAG: cytochrome c oxidase subunit II [Hyphomicrobiaceae bacterium]|nr:cytochrome c oxidase subunit II [Hyphomicrobiaceae bacterium]